MIATEKMTVAEGSLANDRTCTGWKHGTRVTMAVIGHAPAWSASDPIICRISGLPWSSTCLKLRVLSTVAQMC